MAFKRRSFSFTCVAGVGSDEIGLGAPYAQIHEIVVDDNASTEAAVVVAVTDDRALVLFTSDALDVSEGPFVKRPSLAVSDVADDNETVVGAQPVAKSPVTVSASSGGTATITGYLLVEV